MYMRNKPNIGIVALGMVGEPLKKYFQQAGFVRNRNLFCYDTDPKKDYHDDVTKADIIFVAAPTPRNPDGSCNADIVESIIKKYADKDKLFVVKSTVEPGTIERFSKKYKVKILFNPEFLTESRAWEDMVNPDRQVVGHTASTKVHASEVLNLLPRAFFSSPGTLGAYHFTRINATEAEIGKYAGNAFGAAKVAFGNVFADLCEAIEYVLRKEKIKVTVDYNNVRKMIAHDRRIGDAWLDVSHGNFRGFGGYCLPKDLDAIIATADRAIGKLPAKSQNRLLLDRGIRILRATRDYNNTLLAVQGIPYDKATGHDHEIATFLKHHKKPVTARTKAQKKKK
ncbi:MAG: UDP-glucose/GDP-mannose dehydrogenase family protein [Candidatus Niyogibacteria bacterium]|nr:UDP-glucose/GDP-mannose dehydrogenase family protein [Candidatus Niyogibacteria bacterium]